ncbi:MAG: hypothetical protein MSH25_05780, partial [Desulfovibrio sp.]|uniref:hypothetical protein n=1 Tax=Desulfovibrio sp. TaxID=885 RepID=UPI0025C28026
LLRLLPITRNIVRQLCSHGAVRSRRKQQSEILGNAQALRRSLLQKNALPVKIFLSPLQKTGRIFRSPQGNNAPEQFQFETLRVSNPTACRFAEKTRFFRSLWAGRRCAAASRFTFFKGETLYSSTSR